MWEFSLKDRVDYPAVLTTEITNPPTMVAPLEEVDQFVTSVISYDGALSDVYLEWSINQPTFGNAISMSNTMDSTWVSDTPLPGFPEDTKMFFKVFAVGANGDTTETYKFMYYVRFNPDAGITDLKTADFALIFPNPNTGEFTVDLGEMRNDIQITVLSQDGKTVMDEKYANLEKIELDLEIAVGTYFVLINADGLSSVQQVVVEE
jgi:hypothetical protein